MNLTHQLAVAQTQKLFLSQAMKQSLDCLALPIQALGEYLHAAAEANPILEVEDAPLGCAFPETAEKSVDLRDREQWRGYKQNENISGSNDIEQTLFRPQSFSEHLDEQLCQMKELDKGTCALCQFLVGCLNTAGYLDCDLQDLAEELGCSLFDMEQALYIVQSLDPLGVGARNLEECLVLQLAQTPHFNERNLRLIREGLSLLSVEDYSALAALLRVSKEEAKESSEIIKNLNPIPSRGFYSATQTVYAIPEAVFRIESEQIVIEMNRRLLPRVSLNEDYCSMIGKKEYSDIQPYLKEKAAHAKEIKSALEGREKTIEALLTYIAQLQIGYFINEEPLKPMTMRQVADHMGISVSTVSRAVKEKYIEHRGRVIPLRDLFAIPIKTIGDDQITGAAARQQLKILIKSEDPYHPFSDAALSKALLSAGINISRRTVAKYRSEIGIPSASERRRR